MPQLLGSLFSEHRARRGDIALSGEHDHLTRGAVLPTVATVLAVALSVALWRLGSRRVEVEGPSMLPTLDNGDRLLVRRTRRVRVGDLVVVEDPSNSSRLLVKRLLGFDGPALVVVGDNAAVSRDSGDFGPLDRSALIGIAWYRYLPRDAIGRLKAQG